MGERLKNYLKVMGQRLAMWEREEPIDGKGVPKRPKAQTAEEVLKSPLSQTASGRETSQIEQQEVAWRARQLAREKQELLVQIRFFQHERLIHLIVTALFALLSMLVLIWLTVDFQPAAALLFLLLLTLLIPYIRHYYLLENGTQKLYQYYDRLEILLGRAEHCDRGEKEETGEL